MGVRKQCGDYAAFSKRTSAQMRSVQINLCAEVLATTAAASTKNIAATDRFLACKETMAACAYQIAGLKSPLHIVLENQNLW